MGKYITNKWDKKIEIEAGGWVAAWSDDISETDAINGVVAAGVSIYTGSAAVFIAWVKQLVERTIDSLISSASREFPDAVFDKVLPLATDTIKAAIEGKDAKEVLKQYDTVDFKAGAIRYSGRNYEWNAFAQRYDPFGPPTWGMKPYVAFRWRGSVTPGTPPTTPGTPPTTPPGTPPTTPSVHPPENPAFGVLKVKIVNKTSMTLRIKSTRFSNADPVVYSADFPPNTQQIVDYFGGSTRIFAAWKTSNGQLVCSVPIDVYQHTVVMFMEAVAGTTVRPAVEVFVP